MTRNTITISNVSQRFGAVIALDQVGLSLAPGEVRALVGANGSGKSTLVKVVAGYHVPDSGELEVNGSSCQLASRREVTGLWKVSTVHQDLGLIEGLSVTENFFLPELVASHATRLHWRVMQRTVSEYLQRFGVEVSPGRKIEQCDRVTRALIALARAVWDLEGVASRTADGAKDDLETQSPSTLILDELTAFLSIEEVTLLKDVIGRVVSEGHSVLFVSHDLDEILNFADNVSVLRDGRCVADRPTVGVDKDELFTLIAGRPADKTPRVMGGPVEGGDRTRIRALVRSAGSGGVGPVSCDVAPGEILGLTGLVGSGYDLVPYALFGADPSANGELGLPQGTFRLEKLSPADAIGLGVALVPGSRNLQGLWTSLSIAENLSITDPQLSRRPWALSWKRLWERGDRTVAEYAIKAPNSRTRVEVLSGGNAQRVLLAKWFGVAPSLLLLHEPVQGVDVGSRSQIVDLILHRAEQGLAVLCASADHEFLAQVAHRVLVFHHGVIDQELTATPGSSFVTKDDMVWACQVKSSVNVATSGGDN
jgi:ribose transport system ATP-binding protein